MGMVHQNGCHSKSTQAIELEPVGALDMVA
jgi:hypothetical protein